MASQHHGAFGQDRFGRGAEKVARFFGTPQYIVGQTIVVLAWIAANAVAVAARWDPYPFILLNLAFSTQAAYAAPLILLAQTRQADRDKDHEVMIERQRDNMESMEEGAGRRDQGRDRPAHAAARGEHRPDPAGQGAHRAGRRSDQADPRPADRALTRS